MKNLTKGLVCLFVFFAHFSLTHIGLSEDSPPLSYVCVIRKHFKCFST